MEASSSRPTCYSDQSFCMALRLYQGLWAASPQNQARGQQ